MSPTSSPGLRAALRAELTAAMKRRDRLAMAACRSALGAIDNAEAVGIAAPRAGAIESSAVGVGAAEAQRRELSEHDVRAIVDVEVAERRAAAAELPPSVAARAADLRAEADVLATLLVGSPTEETAGDEMAGEGSRRPPWRVGHRQSPPAAMR